MPQSTRPCDAAGLVGVLTGMRAATILLLAGIAGCATPLIPGEPVEFELAIGEVAQPDDSGPSIEFLRVSGDSRCPSDAVCVWAGDAAIVLRFESLAASGDTTLHTTVSPRSMVIDDLSIEVVGLRPTPVSTSPIDPDDYRVRLRVIRR